MGRFPILLAAAALLAACARSSDALVVDLRAYGSVADYAAALDGAVVCLAGGPGVMGSVAGRVDAAPEHMVTLDPFCIHRYEVTNAQYQAFLVSTGHRPPLHWETVLLETAAPPLPIVGIGWSDAGEYCHWAGGRLPTEAEWERACRGTDGRTYPWGSEWDPSRVNATAAGVLEAPITGALGNPGGDGPGLRPVGRLEAGSTPEGIVGLCGNAAEWVADWYDPAAYRTLSSVNPEAPGPEWSHSVRGGGWYVPTANQASLPDLVSCSARDASHSVTNLRIGFRCVFSP